MSTENKVAKTEFKTNLTKVNEAYLPMITNQLENNNITLSEYSKSCVANAISAINNVLDTNGVTWGDASLGQIKNLLSSFAAGIAGGGAILVARRFGAGDFNEARKYANVLVSIIMVLALVLALVLIPLAYPICRISGISEAQAAV